jgi:hypothetical protein
MSKTAPQFDPAEQADSVIDGMFGDIDRVIADLNRLRRHAENMRAEIEQLRDERDQLEIYTEEQVAAILQVNAKTLGDHRRAHKLPHIKIGDKVRYTKQQAAEIIQMFSVGHRSRTALKAA